VICINSRVAEMLSLLWELPFKSPSISTVSFHLDGASVIEIVGDESHMMHQYCLDTKWIFCLTKSFLVVISFPGFFNKIFTSQNKYFGKPVIIDKLYLFGTMN